MPPLLVCHLAWVGLVFLALAALLTGASAHVYLRARRLLSLAQRDRDRAHATLIGAVRMLPRVRRAPRGTPDAAP